jgi:hypothetical protein
MTTLFQPYSFKFISRISTGMKYCRNNNYFIFLVNKINNQVRIVIG